MRPSTRPSVRSFATTLPAAPPVRFDGSRARSSRREAAASSRRWVSVNSTESSIRLRRRSAPPPPKPRNGHEAGGAGFLRRYFALGTVTVPLRSRQEASSFWIILLLVLGRTDNGVIRSKCPMTRLPRSPVPRKSGFLALTILWLRSFARTGSNSTHRAVLGEVSTCPEVSGQERGPPMLRRGLDAELSLASRDFGAGDVG
jgi:hypothetical protein